MLNSGRRKKRVIDTTKDTQFSDVWLILVILLTVAGLIMDSPYLTAAALLLFTVVGAAWLWSRLSLWRLTYRRHFSEIRAFRGETVDLHLEVRNRKVIPLTWLTIHDRFPPALKVLDKELQVNLNTQQMDFNTFWMVGPLQRITRHFQIECTERGFHRYGPMTIETGDGFGFFNRSRLDEETERIIVYPQLYSVAELNLPAKNPFGEAVAPNTLFEDPLRTVGIREWQSSDDLRRVHWKATARQQQMLSRIYEPSEEQQILIFLNVTTMERHWHGYIPELQERTISVAASLAAVVDEQRLSVGLIANAALPESDQTIRLLPSRNPGQLMQILEMLALVTPFATQPIEELLLQEAAHLPWGATLVVVTAIAHEGLLASLIDLIEAGRRVMLFTLAEEPPDMAWLHHKMTVYHLPHLVDDLIAPVQVNG